MRKLLIAGLAVASLTGVVYGQVNGLSEADLKAFNERVRDRARNPPTCVDADGVTRQLEETATIDLFQFRCVETYGDGMKSIGAHWIQVAPTGGRYRYRYLSIN